MGFIIVFVYIEPTIRGWPGIPFGNQTWQFGNPIYHLEHHVSMVNCPLPLIVRGEGIPEKKFT